MDQCARILDAVHSYREKNPGASNTQSAHAPFAFVSVNENAVVSGFATSPGSHGMHALTAHATSPAYVAGCVERSDGGRMDVDLVGHVEEWRGGGCV